MCLTSKCSFHSAFNLTPNTLNSFMRVKIDSKHSHYYKHTFGAPKFPFRARFGPSGYLRVAFLGLGILRLFIQKNISKAGWFFDGYL